MSGRRVLEIRVEEATGVNRVETKMWDDDITEGFVKAEVRGGSSNSTRKAATQKATVQDCKMTFNENLYLDVFDADGELQQGSELRLLLCREKEVNGKRTVSVITACGIFVKDIVGAVPIDKFFELFRPGSGEEGGYIRLRMNLVFEEDVPSRRDSKRKGGGLLKTIVFLGALAGLGVFTKRKLEQK